MVSKILEHLVEAAKTGDMTEISDLNQIGVKKPQMTTESRTWTALAKTGTKDTAHRNNQNTEPEAETRGFAKCQLTNVDE